MLREIILEGEKGEYLGDILKKQGYAALPTNIVLNKRLPGLGATHCEIMAECDSIIIEPNVPVIQSKMAKHPHVLGVYAGIRTKRLTTILRNINATERLLPLRRVLSG